MRTQELSKEHSEGRYVPYRTAAENADSFSLGRTMWALTSWGEHIDVYEEERQDSEKQVKEIEDYEL